MYMTLATRKNYIEFNFNFKTSISNYSMVNISSGKLVCV